MQAHLQHTRARQRFSTSWFTCSSSVLNQEGVYSDFFASLMSFVLYCFLGVPKTLTVFLLWHCFWGCSFMESIEYFSNSYSAPRQLIHTSLTCSRVVVLTIWEELGAATLGALWCSRNRQLFLQSCWIWLCFFPLFNDVVLFSDFVMWQIDSRALFRTEIKLPPPCDVISCTCEICLYVIPGVEKKLVHKEKTSL